MFYKSIKDGKIISIQTSIKPLETSNNFIEITADEYSSISRAFEQNSQEYDEVIEKSKDEYIAELEAENAALLYQILTGDELQDV